MNSGSDIKVIRHKWHGTCDVLSIDGKYCTIRFWEGGQAYVSRVQTRMLNLPPSSLFVTQAPAISPSKLNPIKLCSCKRLEKRDKFGKCLHCHIRALRNWAMEINRLKNEIAQTLSPSNRQKWDAMNSQQKKIAVFRAMELGFISWKIGSRSTTTELNTTN